ncbi:uncharacterized protein L201_006273 [Kwoniella dendrophila CBS 6074]|uniref:Maintenance of telomere capping protein 1 n=1 Tax=Kwoniella dendrophila CBS 6074 TaxID=1295534 RepID=A0AAX4K120_9TREE
MPPKGKKTKAEEALDFLSNLDNLEDAPSDEPNSVNNTATASAALNPAVGNTASEATPRGSTDSSRKSLSASREIVNPTSKDDGGKYDEEAQKALDFLQAQINQKRAPLSSTTSITNKPLSSSTPRSTTPITQPTITEPTPSNIPTTVSTQPVTSSPNSGGWGVSSFWSSATSALQQASKVADEQYKKVKQEGVQGVTHQLENLGVKGVNLNNVQNVVGNVDLNKLRKGAEERLGGIVKGVDLEKLRQDLVNTTTSTLTSILDTVAPPITEHETLELWLSHPMTGYGGVEGVIYRAWIKILEQTESGELIIVWSPSSTNSPSSASKKQVKGGEEEEEETEEQDQEGEGRNINPIEGWEKAWEISKNEIDQIQSRENENPKGRKQTPNPQVPVTTVPIFLHLQPLLAPLPYPEPPIHNTSSSSVPSEPLKHLYFILTLKDPQHSLTFTTISQPSPSDWMDVEYEKSEWVEERLVEILRTSVEVIAQDYVATRMGLKPSAPTSAAVTALVEQANQENDKSKSVSESSASIEKKSD